MKKRPTDKKPAQTSGSCKTSDASPTFVRIDGSTHPLLPTSSVRGLIVRNHEGENLGVLKDLMIETNRGTVAYALLLFEDDKRFAVPYSSLDIDPKNMTIRADIQREVFEQSRGIAPADYEEAT